MTDTPPPGAIPYSAIGQRLMDWACHPEPGLLRSLRWRLALRAREWLFARLGERTVTVQVEGRPLLVPLSHDAIISRACLPDYDRALPRLAAAVSTQRRRCHLIDVGANVQAETAHYGDRPRRR